MHDFAEFDWCKGEEQDRLKMVHNATTSQIRTLAREFDWDQHPVTVLGGVMSQRNIDLGTALTVFMKAGPLQYNYIGKRDVPAAHHDMCRLLDSICQRLNCGFYLPKQGSTVQRADKVDAWMKYQQDDNAEGRVGRWVLNAAIVDTALELSLTVPKVDARLPKNDANHFFTNLIKPFFDRPATKSFRLRA